MRLCREKTRRAKAHLELNLPNVIKDPKNLFGFGGFSYVFCFGFFLFCLGIFCLVLFPVGVSPVNDTEVSYVYKILSSITVQHILFFTSYALSHCSLGPSQTLIKNVRIPTDFLLTVLETMLLQTCKHHQITIIQHNQLGGGQCEQAIKDET